MLLICAYFIYSEAIKHFEKVGMETKTKLALLLSLFSLLALLYLSLSVYKVTGTFFPIGFKTEIIVINGSSVEGTITESTIPNEPSWKYVIFLPPNYSTSKRYPVIIGFHGSGGTARAYIEIWKNDAAKNNFILAFPQSTDPEGWWTGTANNFTLAIIKEMRKSYNISDVLLTGHSAGAKVVYPIALWNPRTFKGIAPISSSFGSFIPDQEDLNNAIGQNFYIVHGENDQLIPLSNAVYAKNVLQNAGANVVFKVLPGRGHEYPVEENENIIKWFLNLESNSAS